MDTLDSKAKKLDVSGLIEQIKVEMPKTYKAIQERAHKNGNAAYELVRRGLRGEVGCFYARERIRKPGALDRWLVAGTGTGMQGLSPEVLEQEFKAGGMVDLVFVLVEVTPCN